MYNNGPLTSVLIISSIIFVISASLISMRNSPNAFNPDNYDIFSYTVMFTFAISYFCVSIFSTGKAFYGTKREKAGGIIVLLSLFAMSLLFLLGVKTGQNLNPLPVVSTLNIAL